MERGEGRKHLLVFRKAGILDPEMDVVSCDMEADPFIDVDESVDLQGLTNDVIPTNDSCSSQEYVYGEGDIPVCNDLDSEIWKENFLH